MLIESLSGWLMEWIESILIHEYQQKSTRVRHESTRTWHESNPSQHESDTSQDESKTGLDQILLKIYKWTIKPWSITFS